MFTSLDRISQNANDAGIRNDRCPLAEVLGQVMGSVEPFGRIRTSGRPAWENVHSSFLKDIAGIVVHQEHYRFPSFQNFSANGITKESRLVRMLRRVWFSCSVVLCGHAGRRNVIGLKLVFCDIAEEHSEPAEYDDYRSSAYEPR